MRLLYSIFVFLIFSFSGKAFNNDSITNHIYTLIYNQQFNQAEELLTKNNELLDPFYLEILNIDLHWWKYSTTRLKTDARNLTGLLKDFNETEQSSQRVKINQLIRKSYQLRYERKRYKLIQVLFLRSEINQLLSMIIRDELPISGEQLKLFDLYISMFRYFENVNPFSLQNKSVEREKELQKMENFARSENLITSTMAHYFLGRIYQKIEREPKKGKTHFEILTQKFPENNLFIEHLADCQ
ncbi:MAG: hypothetical protein HQ522_05520 [Bacteroidetes bacterium]|nr:hypothetical protein [Bacteroidota bacterium]